VLERLGRDFTRAGAEGAPELSEIPELVKRDVGPPPPISHVTLDKRVNLKSLY